MQLGGPTFTRDVCRRNGNRSNSNIIAEPGQRKRIHTDGQRPSYRQCGMDSNSCGKIKTMTNTVDTLSNQQQKNEKPSWTKSISYTSRRRASILKTGDYTINLKNNGKKKQAKNQRMDQPHRTTYQKQQEKGKNSKSGYKTTADRKLLCCTTSRCGTKKYTYLHT